MGQPPSGAAAAADVAAACDYTSLCTITQTPTYYYNFLSISWPLRPVKNQTSETRDSDEKEEIDYVFKMKIWTERNPNRATNLIRGRRNSQEELFSLCIEEEEEEIDRSIRFVYYSKCSIEFMTRERNEGKEGGGFSGGRRDGDSQCYSGGIEPNAFVWSRAERRSEDSSPSPLLLCSRIPKKSPKSRRK